MKTLLLVFFSIIISSSAYSQQENTDIKNVEKIMYLYTFSGVQNEDQLNKVENEISTLKYVEKIKTIYKSESKSGQIIVSVSIFHASAESGENFNSAQLKRVLVDNKLIPGELTVKESPLK